MNTTHPAAAPASNTERNRSKRHSWEDIALWLFLIALFIASGLAAYLFWLQCS